MADQISIKVKFGTQFFEGLAELLQALKVNLHTDSFEGRGLIQRLCERTDMGRRYVPKPLCRIMLERYPSNMSSMWLHVHDNRNLYHPGGSAVTDK